MNPVEPSYDLIIARARVHDGTAAPEYIADIGVRGDRIAAIGDLSEAAGPRVEASGKVLAPGFIDIHTHSDFSILFTRGMESSLAQGVTAEVVGNCGISIGLADRGDLFSLERRGLERVGVALDWNDLGGFLDRVESEGTAIHVATLAGHGTLRKRAMGVADRPPTADELATMCRDLGRALDQGAIGLSSGLEYVPGMYADVAEMTALAKVAREARGFYATHLRDEGDGLVESVGEAIAVAEGAGLPLQLSHHKAERRANWGKVARTLEMVRQARERGLDISLDQYPYTAYQTALSTISLPHWAVGGTPALMAERLRDPEGRAAIRAAMPDTDWSAVVMASCPPMPAATGTSVEALARDAGIDPRDWVLDLLARGEGWISAVHHAMSEADVETVLSDPYVMIGSDSVTASLRGPAAQDRPHPRTFGTFARVLGRYVRQRGVLPLGEAIRRMTSLPADRLGWGDRGRIRVGNVADLVLLDPETVEDAASFLDPTLPARGIAAVWVAGTLAWDGDHATGSRTGRVLRAGNRRSQA
ncbi:MAG: N-acyl-D-amino-acid deacylase family protein [Armatimonadota bacterium]